MVLTITILFFFLFGYFFYLINKQKKIINLNYTQYKKDIEELKNYLDTMECNILEEIENKIKENKEYLKKELHEVNKINQTNLKEKQQQLVLGRWKILDQM